ncbi:MAG: sulfotransferase [Desulfobacteraceae bacterium]|nr:sulfotransferase [Desulfobacteraceae bacterium]
MKVAFLIGSPRSGTTILENILSCHPKIAEFYEPYYIWEKYFNADKSDVWNESDLSDRTIRNIRQEFSIFSQKSTRPLVLDKSPGHSFNIPLVAKVFPEAYWIHIVRDGRDVTLSIKKEWEKRRKMVENKDFFTLFKTAGNMLARQPILRFKLLALLHEFEQSFSLNPYKYLNKSRWQGNVGWGPRFKDWGRFLSDRSVIEFNAMQWRSSVEAVRNYWDLLPRNRKIEVRYEQLLTDTEKTLSDILSLFDYPMTGQFINDIPELMKKNYNKWEQELTPSEIELMGPVLLPMLKAYDYI